LEVFGCFVAHMTAVCRVTPTRIAELGPVMRLMERLRAPLTSSPEYHRFLLAFASASKASSRFSPEYREAVRLLAEYYGTVKDHDPSLRREIFSFLSGFPEDSEEVGLVKALKASLLDQATADPGTPRGVMALLIDQLKEINGCVARVSLPSLEGRRMDVAASITGCVDSLILLLETQILNPSDCFEFSSIISKAGTVLEFSLGYLYFYYNPTAVEVPAAYAHDVVVIAGELRTNGVIIEDDILPRWKTLRNYAHGIKYVGETKFQAQVSSEFEGARRGEAVAIRSLLEATSTFVHHALSAVSRIR
jgi:hypothetical protein